MKGLTYVLAVVAAITVSGSIHAQSADDVTQKDIDQLEMKNSKEFKETEAFINQTQSKIDLVRAETDARAKEIEALADRVGDILSTMSSKDEDNSNLRSELSVSTELLSIERGTTVGLRQETARLQDQIKTEKADREKTETKLYKKITDMNADLTDKEKKLASARQTVAGLTKAKKNLEFDIIALKIRLEQLEKDIALTEKVRNRTPRRARPRPRINP